MIRLFSRTFRGFTSSKYFKKSFSQSGEDLLISFIFSNLLKIKKPSYLDIGANHPFNFNNTFVLYKNGCRGINIDPNPNSIRLFKKFRKEDTNLQIGINDKPGKLILYTNANSMLNTFDENLATKNGDIIDKIDVSVETIHSVLDQHNKGIFPDLLSLDAEGMDMRILKSIDFENNFPKVICVETIEKLGENEWIKNDEIIQYLKSRNYLLHSDTFINSLFIHKNILRVKIR